MNIPKDNHSTAHITRIHFTSSSLMAGYVVPLGSTIKNTACYPPRQPSFYQLLSQLCYQKSPIHPLLVRNHSFSCDESYCWGGDRFGRHSSGVDVGRACLCHGHRAIAVSWVKSGYPLIQAMDDHEFVLKPMVMTGNPPWLQKTR